MNTMQAMIDNLINGNLKDAQKQAKLFSGQSIFKHLRSIGWSEEKALATLAKLRKEME